MILLANLVARHGQADEAVELLQAGRTQIGDDPISPIYLSLSHNLGNRLLGLGRTAEARPILTEVLAGRRKILGPSNRRTLLTQATLAELEEAEGNMDEARRLIGQTLDQAIKALGEAHPNTTLYQKMAKQMGALDEKK